MKRRRQRAQEAGALAVAELNRSIEAAKRRERINLRITVTCWSSGKVVWNVWDANPLFDEQIEGVLVPYAHGMAANREEAEQKARHSINISDTAFPRRLYVAEVVASWPDSLSGVK